ncbi:hypothetical protein ARMGADRAFT_866034, partial [Armillaria gallica]
LQEKLEIRDIKAQELAESVTTECELGTSQTGEPEPMMTIEMMLQAGPNLDQVMNEDDGFLSSIKQGYKEDTLFKIVLDSPTEHNQFEICDEMIWTHNRNGDQVLCIPRVKFGDQSLQGVIIDEAHKVLGHYRFQHTSEYMR